MNLDFILITKVYMKHMNLFIVNKSTSFITNDISDKENYMWLIIFYIWP